LTAPAVARIVHLSGQRVAHTLVFQKVCGFSSGRLTRPAVGGLSCSCSAFSEYSSTLGRGGRKVVTAREGLALSYPLAPLQDAEKPRWPVIPRSPPSLLADDEESRIVLIKLRARFLSRGCGIGMTLKGSG